MFKTAFGSFLAVAAVVSAMFTINAARHVPQDLALYRARVRTQAATHHTHKSPIPVSHNVSPTPVPPLVSAALPAPVRTYLNKTKISDFLFHPIVRPLWGILLTGGLILSSVQVFLPR